MTWIKITPQESFPVRTDAGKTEEVECDSAHITAIGYEYFSGMLQIELTLGGYDSDDKFHPWPKLARRVMRVANSRALNPELWAQLDLDNAGSTIFEQATDALSLIAQAGNGVALCVQNYVPEIGQVESELCDDDGNPISMTDDASPERPDTVIPWDELIRQLIKPGAVTQTADGEYYKAILLMVGSLQTAPPNITLWRKYRDLTADGEEWPEWVQPIDRYDSYQKGDPCSRNGKHYVSIIDFNVWDPALDIQPAVWHEETDDGADEWPPFVKPTGAHDAYKKGDKITWTEKTGGDGGRYISKMDGNVWSPGEYPDAWERQK